MNNETLADIAREMRTYFQAQKRGNPEHRPWHQVLSDWAARIEAAVERERNRQYEPKCNWSIRDALALANTLANHGLRDGNADAASSCIYSLCRILSSHGDAAAMRAALLRVKEARGRDLEYVTLADIDADVDAALGASPRNCEALGDGEQRMKESGAEVGEIE